MIEGATAKKMNLPQRHRGTEGNSESQISDFRLGIALPCVLAFLSVSLCLRGEFARADDRTYRTDADPASTKLPWFSLNAQDFPPPDSAHYMAGELIAVDHVNRTGSIRIERTDAIRRGEWDNARAFTLLPYGHVSYHGAPAELRDVPIGTHLHGYFYLSESPDKDKQGPFTRALSLEDDFSYFARTKRTWRVGAYDAEKQSLTVTGLTEGTADAKPTNFVLTSAAQVFKSHGLGNAKDLTSGQSVFLNLTVCTLKGPGRVVDAWLDDDSRAAATAHQFEVHRQFIREHGLPAQIDAVDNQQGTLTVTLFAGFDPSLLRDFAAKEGVTACVAEPNLRTYDQINDRMGGSVLAIDSVANPPPGHSGTVITFKPNNLLEGFRPKRILRIFSGKWKVDDLPKEERLYQ